MKKTDPPTNQNHSEMYSEEDMLKELFLNNPDSLVGKVLQLRQNALNKEPLNDHIWQELLSEWPDKRLLFKLKNNDFDLRAAYEAIQEPEVINERAEQSSRFEPDQFIEHIGFIWQIEETVTPDTFIESPATEQHTALDMEALKHITFVYQLPEPSQDAGIMEPDAIEATEEKTQEAQASVNSEKIDISQPTDFVSWLKMLDSKVKGVHGEPNMSKGVDSPQNEALIKSEESRKNKEAHAERKSKTAKKLIKKSRKELKKKDKKKDESKGEKKKKKASRKHGLKEYIFSSLEEPEDLASETFAALLAKQGHKDKAIKMYEKLILLNPEKSSFFADKILQLKNKE